MKLSDGDFKATAGFLCDGQFGIASPSLQFHKTDYGIAGLALSGFRPSRDDFASNVAARDEWKLGTQDEAQLTLTNLPVDRIDARGANAHKNLVGQWPRVGYLTQMQLINAAVVVDDDRFHFWNSY